MQYTVRLFDPRDAAVREVVMDASSSESVLQEIAMQGLVLLAPPVAQGGRSNLKGMFGGDKQPQAALDVAWWCREVRTLISAGMTVVEAMETLNAQQLRTVLGRSRERVNAEIVDKLRQGQALSQAMIAVGAFPAMLVAGVKASERTSSLVSALDDYLSYHGMLERLRKQIVSAAIYPAVVAALGSAVTLFLLLFVIPRFSKMYADLKGPVSTATTVLVSLSHLLNQHGAWVMGAALTLIVVLAWAWQTGHISQWARLAAEHIVPLRVRLDEFRLAKLYHSLALMFRGGYTLDDALRQCAELGLGERLRYAVLAAERSLTTGQSVSVAFSSAGLTDAVSLRLLAVGERTGSFERVLQTIAERHATNFGTFVERTTRLVEPLLLLTVALVVGGIVVMMYMPVFDVASSVR